MPARGRALTAASLKKAAALLARRDADLAAVIDRCGMPELFSRAPGFASLVYIILEQQVSLASARASFDKLATQLPAFTPQAYLTLSDKALRAAGVSRQKTRYTRLVANAILDGSLPIEQLSRFSDERVRRILTALTGIGDWTADVYMMSALRRADLWPVGDLALVKAAAAIKGVEPGRDKRWLVELGEQYRPYRSVAAQIYWRHYLHKGG